MGLLIHFGNLDSPRTTSERSNQSKKAGSETEVKVEPAESDTGEHIL